MNCHRCNYDLTGLPQEHRCPECGLAYGESVRVWKPVDNWIFMASPALLMLMHIASFPMPSGPAKPWRLPLYLLLAGLSAWNLIRALQRARLGLKLVLTPQGVFVRNAEDDHWLPFETINRLLVDLKVGYFRDMQRVKIVPAAGRPIELSLFLTTPAKVREFEREFEQALLRFHAHCAATAGASGVTSESAGVERGTGLAGANEVGSVSPGHSP